MILPSVFFFGREQEGLSEAVVEASNCKLHIPMVGFTESLNISVSAAIVLQHVTSKLRETNDNWHLSEFEKMEKRMEWAKKVIKSHEKIIERYHKEQQR